DSRITQSVADCSNHLAPTPENGIRELLRADVVEREPLPVHMQTVEVAQNSIPQIIALAKLVEFDLRFSKVHFRREQFAFGLCDSLGRGTTGCQEIALRQQSAADSFVELDSLTPERLLPCEPAPPVEEQRLSLKTHAPTFNA